MICVSKPSPMQCSRSRYMNSTSSLQAESYVSSLQVVISRTLLCALAVLCLGATTWSAPGAGKERELQIYFVDVEGGQATLFVTPAGQSLLIDTGWSGNDGRDADRIVAAAKRAAIERIDFVLLTHFHQDHAGGDHHLPPKIST